jgi:hypothetical protein
MRHASIGMLITGVRKTPKICVGVAQLPSGPKIPLVTIQPKRSGNPRTYEAASTAHVAELCPFALLSRSIRKTTETVLTITAASA